MKAIIALLILVAAVSVSAQEPSSLEKAIRELQAEIESTRAEVKALRIQQEKTFQRQARRERRGAQAAAKPATAQQPPARKKHVQVSLRIQEEEQRLETTEIVLAELAEQPEKKAKTPEQQRKVIADLVIERNQLREKIKRANHRWHCRYMRIGCIGRK